MTRRPDRHAVLLVSTCVLLVATWLAGGVTVDHTSADEILELMALPVLCLAGWLLLAEGLEDGLQRAGVAALVAIAAVPALQLLPIPESLWMADPWRRALAADLAVAGVPPPLRWSLAPAQTESALWALLPAAAAFLAALSLRERRARQVLVHAVLALVAFNVLFAFSQASLPLHSTARLYGALDNGFGGLFVNTNHHATALVIGMVLATGQAVHARRRVAGQGHRWIAYAGFATLCLLLVPLTTSRAGMVIALPALAAVLLLTGGVRPTRLLRRKSRLASLAVVVLLVAVGIHAALGWMEIDIAEEQRHLLAGVAFAIGKAQAPLGGGIGSFVPLFEQNMPDSLWDSWYINHAHNEYAQWWMEGGVLAVLVLAAVLVVLGVAALRIARRIGTDGDAILAASCVVAMAAVMAHSWADYPLRTLALMTTTGALAGVMLTALSASRARTVPPAA